MEKELTAREKFKEILDGTFIKNYDKPENNKEKIRIFCEKVQKLKPQKLFRYRKIDDNNNFYDALCKNLITTSNPINFNDPFDSLIYVNVQEILDDLKNPRSRTKFKKWLEYNPALVQSLQAKQKSILKGFLNESDDKYRLNIRVALPKIEKSLSHIIAHSIDYLKTYSNIACFSETIKSPIMWSHYVDSHKGFALEYDFKNYNSPCINCSNKCRFAHYDLLFPVIYSDERFNAKDFIASYFVQSIFAKVPFGVFVPIDDDLAIYKILLRKSMDWKYEQEWRIISHCNTKPAIYKKPTAIYLGVNMSTRDKNLLIDFANKNNIPVHEMYIEHNSKEYAMNSKQISN